MTGQRAAPPTELAEYLEAMSRAVFTSGISWSVIENKWDGIRTAFRGFDPYRVAAYSPVDIDRLMIDPHVIRNRKKSATSEEGES